MSERTSDRWYPNAQRLATPEKTNSVLKEVLDRHYALVDKVNAMGVSPQPAEQSRIVQPGGPTNTRILGLPVGPTDVQSLANGATLKYVKASGLFLFS